MSRQKPSHFFGCLAKPFVHRALGGADGGRDLPVCVSVVMPQYESSPQPRREPAERGDQVAVERQLRRVGPGRRPAQASQDHRDGAQALFALVRHGRVDRDPVQPRLSRRIRPPAGPGSKRGNERVLCAVFGSGGVAEDGEQRPVDLGVAVPIQAVEVVARTRPVYRRFVPDVDSHEGNNERDYIVLSHGRAGRAGLYWAPCRMAASA
jgi:hypothetical protein